MLKDLLMTEAAELEVTPVKLDGIFESANMTKEVQDQFALVFETTVRKYAVALAESHIEKISDKADQLVESQVEEQMALVESKTVESVGTFLEHVSRTWLSENTVAITRGIQADLFESLASHLKTVFVEHNIVVPDESVDVVAELEEELSEANATAVALLDSKNLLVVEHAEYRRSVEFEKLTLGLTESQREKVSSFVEGIEYNDDFSKKVTAIVEMTKASKSTDKTLNEQNINISNNEAGLNYVVEAANSKPVSGNARANAYATLI